MCKGLLSSLQRKEHKDKFLNYLNLKHCNISFTVKHGADNLLLFLDADIRKSDDGFVTDVYKKELFTRLCLSYMPSLTLLSMANSIKTLIKGLITFISLGLSLQWKSTDSKGYSLHTFEIKLKLVLTKRFMQRPARPVETKPIILTIVTF